MDENMKKRTERLAQTVIKGLQSRNMTGYYAEDKEVALKLNISIRTVQTHIASILLKLKARNRVNAVVVYMHLNPKWKIAERYVVV